MPSTINPNLPMNGAAMSSAIVRQQFDAAITDVNALQSANTTVQGSIATINTALNGKQNTLVSGTNIKTVNGTTLLGSGDLVVSGSGGPAAWGSITGTLSSQTDLNSALNGKQNTLVSGTNIKTVGGITLLGSGDIPVTGGGGVVNQINTTAPLTGGASAATVTIALANGTANGQVLTWNGTAWGAGAGGGSMTPPVSLATNANPQAIAVPALFQLAALDNTNTSQFIDASGTGVPTLELRKMGNTMQTPSVPGVTTNLGNLRVTGLTATPGTFGSGLEIQVVTSATAWSPTSQGTVVNFQIGRDGMAGRQRAFWVNSGGGFVVGSPTNPNQAAGSLNTQTLYINGTLLATWIENRYGLTPI